MSKANEVRTIDQESLQDTDCSDETRATRPSNCIMLCCLHNDDTFQPIDKKTPSTFYH